MDFALFELELVRVRRGVQWSHLVLDGPERLLLPLGVITLPTRLTLILQGQSLLLLQLGEIL